MPNLLPWLPLTIPAAVMALALLWGSFFSLRSTFVRDLLIALARSSPAFNPVRYHAPYLSPAAQILISLERASPAFDSSVGTDEGTLTPAETPLVGT